MPLLIDPGQPWKKAAFTEWGNQGEQGSVRTRRYRYSERLLKGRLVVELYEHATDPWETVNLADDPAWAPTPKELAALPRGGWKAALPPGKSDR